MCPLRKQNGLGSGYRVLYDKIPVEWLTGLEY